jgi:hypothetical protein
MEKRKMGLMGAIKDYFGFLPGEDLKGFAVEVKKLTEADRAEFKTALEKLGYEIEISGTVAPAKVTT